MNTYLTHPTAGTGGTPVALALPDDLAWSDEFTWRPVEQTTEYSTRGALVVDSFSRQAGRTITLHGSETSAWVTRATVDTLQLWASQTGVVFELHYRGVSRNVIFNHGAGALDADPIIDYSAPEVSDFYSATLRFLEL